MSRLFQKQKPETGRRLLFGMRGHGLHPFPRLIFGPAINGATPTAKKRRAPYLYVPTPNDLNMALYNAASAAELFVREELKHALA
jgi:hypothetical protein